MFPTLIQIGPVAISTMGVLLSLGYFLGTFLIWQKTKEEHYDETQVMDGILWVTVIGLIFSRLWYVVFNWHKFGSILSPFELVKRPGFSWAGALLAGLITIMIYVKRRKWDFYKFSDLTIFGLTIGMIFAKIGLFFNNFVPGENFPSRFLWEAGLLTIIYGLLVYLDKNYRTYEWYKNKRGEANPGFLFLSFIFLTNLIGLGDSLLGSPFYGLSSIDFWFNLLMIVIAIFLFFGRAGKGLTFSKLWLKKDRGPLLKKKKADFHFKTGMEAK